MRKSELFKQADVTMSNFIIADRKTDYLLPPSDAVPNIEIHHMESPSPFNPLGVKGAAESGTIGAPAAIVSAIEDALKPLHVRITDLPVTPPRLLALIAHQIKGDRRGFGT